MLGRSIVLRFNSKPAFLTTFFFLFGINPFLQLDDKLAMTVESLQNCQKTRIFAILQISSFIILVFSQGAVLTKSSDIQTDSLSDKLKMS